MIIYVQLQLPKYCTIVKKIVNLYREMKDYIIDLWIRKSASPYSSPMVCVGKKDMTPRLCVDYRALDNKTVQSRRLISRIQDSLNRLRGNSWFTTLDQEKAYHQGFMKTERTSYTALITPLGLYEWLRIPFVVTGAPVAFQEFMEETLSDQRDEVCIPYLDFSSSFDDHLRDVLSVLKRIKGQGIKPGKCFLLRPREFLSDRSCRDTRCTCIKG